MTARFEPIICRIKPGRYPEKPFFMPIFLGLIVRDTMGGEERAYLVVHTKKKIMVEGFEQLYQDTADAIADVLYRHLPASFDQTWIHAEMPGRSGEVACYYSVRDEPGKAFWLNDDKLMVDMYLIFDWLRARMQKAGDTWSTASLMISAQGEFSIQLGREDLAKLVEQADTPWDRRNAWAEHNIPRMIAVAP
jgi:hypothetical protein